MSTIFFLILCCIMLVFSRFISGKSANALTLLMLPYLLIIVINNFFMVNSGFNLVTTGTLEFLLITFFIFEMGSVFSKLFTTKTLVSENNINSAYKIRNYNMKKMTFYVVVVILLSFIRLALVIFKSGISYIGSEDFSGFLTNGIVGKLLLSCFPLTPIILFEWFNRKKDSYLLLIVIAVFSLSFLTFVKYHVISLVLITFIFLYMKDRRFFL